MNQERTFQKRMKEKVKTNTHTQQTSKSNLPLPFAATKDILVCQGRQKKKKTKNLNWKLKKKILMKMPMIMVMTIRSSCCWLLVNCWGWGRKRILIEVFFFLLPQKLNVRTGPNNICRFFPITSFVDLHFCRPAAMKMQAVARQERN